jgi:hypothetical protein
MESDLLRTPAALERALAVPVLGAIPAMPGQKDAPQSAAQPGRLEAPTTA